ncbi:MAG: copper-binding protein [Burkholderiales bacterium]|jgi:Cu(I)/Ag(I) efflux system protein CusF
MNMQTQSRLVAAVFSSVITLVSAQAHHNHGSSPGTAAKAEEKSATAKPEMVAAEVKKVDMDAKKITLKHGEIKSLDMTPMTMVFQVKDVKLIENLKAGDKVKFSAEQTKSGYAVTSIEVAK